MTKAPKLSKTESHSNIIQRSSKRFDDKKGNHEMKKKDNDGKRGQKSPTHSNSVLVSPNSLNSIKKPTS